MLRNYWPLSYMRRPSSGGAGAAGHRYWRINLRATSGGAVVTSEIEMRLSAGGADVTGAGSSSLPNAFDNNAGTTVSNFAGSTIPYDFGAGNAPLITEIAITPSSGATMTEFDIQYSDDGSAWVTDWVGMTTGGWSAGVARVFTKPSAVAHRYWRIHPYALQSAGQTLMCAECELRSSIGGADQTGSGSASQKTTWTSAAFAFDNNVGTASETNDNFNASQQNEWLMYDFGSGVTKSIVQVAWTTPASNFGRAPTSGALESSPDGISWLPRIAFSGLTWSSGSTNLIS